MEWTEWTEWTIWTEWTTPNGQLQMDRANGQSQMDEWNDSQSRTRHCLVHLVLSIWCCPFGVVHLVLSIWCCPFSCPFVSIKHKPWSSANIISLLRSLKLSLTIPTLVPLALHIGLLLNLLLCSIGNVHIMNDD
jgi:hypothetical protein